MPQVPVGLKRRVLQQGGRGLPGGPLLATTASDNLSYLAFFNISPRTPRKCIRTNGSRVCCLPESSSSQRWSVDLVCSLGLGERWRKVLLAPHTGGPSIPCTHGEKVALRRECYADHTEQVCHKGLHLRGSKNHQTNGSHQFIKFWSPMAITNSQKCHLKAIRIINNVYLLKMLSLQWQLFHFWTYLLQCHGLIL